MVKKKLNRKKPAPKNPKRAPKAKPRKKVSAKASPSKKPARAKKPAPPKKRTRSSEPTSQPSARIHQGVGLSTGGQSGDNQGLSIVESADSESVEELIDEGQAYEAEVVSGVENAPDPDQSEVTTKEVPEDDVPPEYDRQ
jgi:hypothetical protein